MDVGQRLVMRVFRGLGLLARVSLLLIACAASAAAQETTRRALIIANTNYADKIGRLVNPAKDAQIMRKALMAVGFPAGNIAIVHDATRNDMLGAIEQYAGQLGAAGPGAVGLLYYSGHGIVKPGTDLNYLVPKDITEFADAVSFKAVQLNEVRDALERNAPQAVNIVVFDACRNELQTGQRGGTKGFVPVQDWGGMLIAYSTSPGQTASDGAPDAPAGPYAMALAEQLMMARGLSASDLFENVRFAVKARTNGQAPWFLHGLDRKVRFDAQAVAALDPGSAKPTLLDPAQAWSDVRNVDSVAVLEAFLKTYGDSGYAVFARARLQELEDKQKAEGPALARPAAPPDPACDGVGVAPAEGARQCIKPGSGHAFRDCPDCPEMVVLPRGQFAMGAPDAQVTGAGMIDGPLHQVTIPEPFAVSKFEVTEAEWQACVDQGACAPKPADITCKKADCALSNLSWSRFTSQYLKWISAKTGQTYRLLSEAEWEYAARAGSRETYGFGAEAQRLASFAWFAANSGAKVHSVGRKQRNGWGLYDMHGNVAELVEDCWNPSYAEKPQDLRMTGGAWKTGDCKFVVFRGGAWNDVASDLGSAVRGRAPADQRGANIGFRVARALAP